MYREKATQKSVFFLSSTINPVLQALGQFLLQIVNYPQ